MTEKYQICIGGKMKADYQLAYQKANELLVSCKSITKFPVCLMNIIKECTDFEFMSFAEFEKYGLKAESVVGSNDGGLLENSGQYILVYNEKKPNERVRFTMGHELGHYELGHDCEILKHFKNTHDERFKMLYDKYEKEANLFSAQILMPEQVIKELSKRGCYITEDFLMKHFVVSRQAAQVRLANLNKVYSSKCLSFETCNYDDVILLKFKSFIDSIAPRKHTYEYDCEHEIEMEKLRQSWN